MHHPECLRRVTANSVPGKIIKPYNALFVLVVYRAAAGTLTPSALHGAIGLFHKQLVPGDSESFVIVPNVAPIDPCSSLSSSLTSVDAFSPLFARYVEACRLNFFLFFFFGTLLTFST